jgi:PAS domain-containing protein
MTKEEDVTTVVAAAAGVVVTPGVRVACTVLYTMGAGVAAGFWSPPTHPAAIIAAISKRIKRRFRMFFHFPGLAINFLVPGPGGDAGPDPFNVSRAETQSDFILVCGPDTRVLYVNPALAGAMGYAAETMAGTPLLPCTKSSPAGDSGLGA